MQAIIINNINSVEYLERKNFLYKSINLKQFVFFTLSNLIVEKFKKHGVSCFILDRMLSRSEAISCKTSLMKLGYTWFRKTDGRDFFEYLGIPLAEISVSDFRASEFVLFFKYFYNIEKIIDNYNITKIYCDNVQKNLFENCFKIFNIDYEFIDDHEYRNYDVISPIKDTGVVSFHKCANFYKKSFFYKTCLSIINFMKKTASLFLCKKEKIIMGLYNNTSILFNMLSSKLASKFNFLLVNTSIDRKKMFTYDLNFLNLGALKKSNYSSISSDLFFNLEEVKKKFMINGYDCSSYFIPELKKYIEKAIPYYADMASTITALIKNNGYKVFVTCNDCAPLERTIAYICRMNNIKVVKLQHAFYPYMVIDDSLYNISDYVFVMLEQNMDLYKNSKNLMLSSPIYDVYSRIGHVHDVKKRKYRVLINPFHPIENEYYISVVDGEENIFTILNVLRKYKENFEIHFRLHPGISDEFLMYIVKSCFADLDIKFSKGGTFFDVIKNSDLLISTFSTTIFESAAAGVPSLFYKQVPCDLISPFDEENKDLPQASTPEELSALLKKFLHSFNEKGWFINKDIIQKYGIFRDGKNSERIWAKIDEIIKSK